MSLAGLLGHKLERRDKSAAVKTAGDSGYHFVLCRLIGRTVPVGPRRHLYSAHSLVASFRSMATSFMETRFSFLESMNIAKSVISRTMSHAMMMDCYVRNLCRSLELHEQAFKNLVTMRWAKACNVFFCVIAFYKDRSCLFRYVHRSVKHYYSLLANARAVSKHWIVLCNIETCQPDIFYVGLFMLLKM